MDKTSLLTLLFNSIATIVTTYVVTRVSLGKPVFVVNPSVRVVALRLFALSFCAVMVIWSVEHVLAFLSDVGPPTRSQVVFIPLTVFNVFAYSFLLLGGILRLTRKRVRNSPTTAESAG